MYDHEDEVCYIRGKLTHEKEHVSNSKKSRDQAGLYGHCKTCKDILPP